MWVSHSSHQYIQLSNSKIFTVNGMRKSISKIVNCVVNRFNQNCVDLRMNTDNLVSIFTAEMKLSEIECLI